MASRSAASEVFRQPDLCAMILQHFDDSERFELQNLSRGTRDHLLNHGPYLRFIMHQMNNNKATVVPIPDPVDISDVVWVYTSGEHMGEMVWEEEDADIWHDHRFQNAPINEKPWKSREDQMYGVRINRLLQQKFLKFCYYPNGNKLGIEERLPRRSIFYSLDASYRSMLLTTPPLSVVEVMDFDGNCSWVTNPEGITAGDVIDALLR